MKKSEIELFKKSKIKRPVTISLTVDPDLLAKVDAKREKLGLSRASVIDELLREFLEYRL